MEMNISNHLFSIKNTVLGMLILPLLLTGESSAEIYKWVDAEGNVHYAQQRPNDADAERLDIQQEPTTTFRSGTNKPVKTEETARDSEQPAEEPAAQEEKKVETPAEKKQRLAACAKARKALTTMKSVGRIRSKDADGNYSYLSQQQKEAKMKQARDLIKKYCY